jgi:WD40 repeat protein
MIASANGPAITFWTANSTALVRLHTLNTAHAHSLTALKCMPYLAILVSGHSDGTLIFWNLNSGKSLATLKRVNGTNVKWSLELIGPDVLVVGTNVQRMVEFWNVSSFGDGLGPRLVDQLETNVNITALSINFYSE